MHFKAMAIKKTAKLNASFSPVSLANFFYMEDEEEAKTKDNILDKQRSYHKNKYGDATKINFQIEPINGLSYKYLFRKSLDIIIEKLEDIIDKLNSKEIHIEPIENINNSYNFKIDNEDDTIGNLIQSVLHNKYIRDAKTDECTYVGYICPHPLISQLVVRFTLNTTKEEDFYKFFIDNCKEIIKIIENIKKEWLKFAK